MDVAKATVRAYYNADAKGHASRTDSPYITQMLALTRSRLPELTQACRSAASEGARPAAVFDADDTTLMTYDMEDSAMHFEFTPQLQQQWLESNDMPATPGMVDMVRALSEAGCTIIGLTGRHNGQKDLTLANLARVGYVDAAGRPLFAPDLYFTKFRSEDPMPDYLRPFCDENAHRCTTVQYKAGTREHIATDLGYTIVANVGDQWSDLQGGRAQHWVKLPNAIYYLPSPNLPEWRERDLAAGMDPHLRTYTVAPDGSSGRAPGVDGDALPNNDIVKATIRTYYNAHATQEGRVADRDNSPYISEMRALTGKWIPEITEACSAARAAGEKPAITLDADDTTLMTYDMEEAFHFAFDAAKQLDYLKTNYHALPPTPGMVDLVRAASQAGCTIVGLTGRSDELKDVTLRNLAEAGYTGFSPDLYLTKRSSLVKELPEWVRCAGEKCHTVEFKSSARRHLEDDLGLRIVANFGDQWSDLKGGYADRHIKLPNPTYYLP